jgi:uncharacterized protein DUF1275
MGVSGKDMPAPQIDYEVMALSLRARETHRIPADTVTPGGQRFRDSLLIALTVASGAVDAISYFGLGKTFSAFITGNMVFLGIRNRQPSGTRRAIPSRPPLRAPRPTRGAGC